MRNSTRTCGDATADCFYGTRLQSTVGASGFTVLDTLIALAIAALLVAVALPSYQQHRVASVAAEGRATLLALHAKQERLRLTHGRYQSADVLLSVAQNMIPESVLAVYDLAVDLADDGRFHRLSLTPRANQAAVETLALDSLGRRTPVDSWQ